MIVIVGSSSLTAGNIKNGVTIFGVKGTFTGWVDSTMAASVIIGTNTLRVDGSVSSSSGDVFQSNWEFDHSTQMNKVINAGFNWLHVEAHGYMNVGGSTASGNAGTHVKAYYWSSSTNKGTWTGNFWIGGSFSYYMDGDGGTYVLDKRSSFDIPLIESSNSWWLKIIAVWLSLPKREYWGYTEITNGWFKK